MVESNVLSGILVKAEHTRHDISSVVSLFLDSSSDLQCVLELYNSLEDAIASRLVREGIVLDLSMGCTVDVQQSGANGATGSLVAGKKNTLEVSLVRKGFLFVPRFCFLLHTDFLWESLWATKRLSHSIAP